jgi:tetratricopeptide (TPR) repeat protein
MERQKYIVTLALAFYYFVSLKADHKTDIYQSYINNDMHGWRTIIDNMQAAKVKSDDFLWELVNYQYGYIAWCLGNDKQADAEKYLDFAEQNISILEKRTQELSMIYVYKTAFYGYRIGLNLWKAPLLGTKSIESAKQAIDYDPLNPYGYIQLGNIEYYMPAAFGGSKNKALYYFLKAKKLIEQNPDQVTGNWNYLGLLTTIANAYYETGSMVIAKKYYERILEIEPGFRWVKDELYPRLLKELKE